MSKFYVGQEVETVRETEELDAYTWLEVLHVYPEGVYKVEDDWGEVFLVNEADLQSLVAEPEDSSTENFDFSEMNNQYETFCKMMGDKIDADIAAISLPNDKVTSLKLRNEI